MLQFCFRRGSKAQPPRLHSFSFPDPSPVARSAAMPWCRRRLRSFLCVSVASVLLVVVSVAHAEPIATEQHSVATAADPISTMVAQASQRFSIPASWIRAVMQVESFGDVRALSPKGAMGLMQIMPESWATLRSRYGLGADPYDAHATYWPVLPISASCWIATVLLAFWLPTMPGRRVTKIISRLVARCLRRHRLTWPRSLR
jgi:soluble lytic murein transglycosylase-like protein